MDEPNPNPALPHLLAFALGTLSLADFEAWVYATPDLEPNLSRDVATGLLELDYRVPGLEARLRWEVVHWVEDLAGPEFLVRERARLLLRRLADGSGEVIPVCAALAELAYKEGAEWMGSIFVAFDAELEDPLAADLLAVEPRGAGAAARRDAAGGGALYGRGAGGGPPAAGGGIRRGRRRLRPPPHPRLPKPLRARLPRRRETFRRAPDL